MENAWMYVWLALIIGFGIVEAATMGLTSIWFAFGALAAMITAAAGGEQWLQIVIFIVVSAITLFLLRPVAKNFLGVRKTATNSDRVIGQNGIVTETIDNLKQTGAVSVSGKVWTARSAADEVIALGSVVRVERIEGVKLIVLAE